MITGALIYGFLTQSRIRMMTVFIFLSIVVFGLFVKYYQVISDYSQYLAIIDKLTLSGNTASDSDRTAAWSTAIADGFSSPLLGNGSGYGKIARENGYLSVFLLMLGDYGIIAFLLFTTLWILLWYKVIMVKDKIRPYLLLSFFSVTIGMAVGDISNSFVQWLLIPIIYKYYCNRRLSTFQLKLNHMDMGALTRGEWLLVKIRRHVKHNF